jgi:hypothetical protein
MGFEISHSHKYLRKPIYRKSSPKITTENTSTSSKSSSSMYNTRTDLYTNMLPKIITSSLLKKT